MAQKTRTTYHDAEGRNADVDAAGRVRGDNMVRRRRHGSSSVRRRVVVVQVVVHVRRRGRCSASSPRSRRAVPASAPCRAVPATPAAAASST